MDLFVVVPEDQGQFGVNTKKEVSNNLPLPMNDLQKHLLGLPTQLILREEVPKLGQPVPPG